MKASVATPGGTVRRRKTWVDPDRRQFHWMVTVGFLLLLLPAAVARLSGWRWQPWPPGSNGYGSIVGEAKGAAENYILFAFSGV